MFLETQERGIQVSLAQENSLLKGRKEYAEQIAPREEWEERLAKDDLPADIFRGTALLHKTKAEIEFLKKTRMGNQRKTDIDAVRLGFFELFGLLSDIPTKKKGKKK